MSINLSQSSFTAGGGATQSRTFGDRAADILNALDYTGVDNTGTVNCGAAVQAVFDKAFGPAGSPHGSSTQLNKAIYFPHGTYLIDQELVLTDVESSWIFGDGQRNTRFVYTGPDSGAGATALLTTKFLSSSRVQGIAFDVTGSNAQTAVWTRGNAGNGGTTVSWINCAFIGATSYGWLSDAPAEGSEQLFVKCLFDSCDGSTAAVPPTAGGLVVASANALDYTIIGCSFTNCYAGIACPAGAINLVQGCYFHNNANVDIWVKQSTTTSIVGCYSDSPTFALAGPCWIAGCSHVTASAGTFWHGLAGSNPTLDQDYAHVIIEGCYSPNSVLTGHNDSAQGLYFRGNRFDRSDALTSYPGARILENI